MNTFYSEDDYLVLAKSLKSTKKDEKGISRQYGSISLYSPKNDNFLRVSIFDNYQEILSKYEVNKIQKIRLQITTDVQNGKCYIKIAT